MSVLSAPPPTFCFFFFNDTATTEIYTLSLHDALPICPAARPILMSHWWTARDIGHIFTKEGDRKSTRLNSSHGYISYAVFCLKKKKHPPAPAHVTPGLTATPLTPRT